MDGTLITERRIFFPLKNLEPKTDFTVGETAKTIGASTGNGRLSLIDEFKIFDRVLSSEEIRSLYEADNPHAPLKNLVTAGYGKDAFTGTGFSNMKTGEYAVRQDRFSLGFDEKNLYVSLKNPAPDAKLLLTSPSGKTYPYSLKNEAVVPLAEIGLKPGDNDWTFNIISGGNDLNGGARLSLDKNSPKIAVNSLYDLQENKLDLNLGRMRNAEMIFDTDTTHNYGFSRVKRTLENGYSQSTKNIADRTLATLILNHAGKEIYRNDFVVRKNQPLAVKFLYTLLETHELFVAFQGKTDGSAVADFVNPQGKTAYSEKLEIPKDSQLFFNLKFPLHAEPGNYVVKISHVAPDGKKTFLWDQELRVPPKDDPLIRPYVDPEKDKVPPGGWTPVVAEKDSVQIWGRKYMLDKGTLFSSLTSLDKELLAEPDRLILDGTPLVPKGKIEVKKLESNDVAATYLKTVDYGVCKVESKIRIAFDGYARITMKIIPQGAMKVNSLAFELPLKNEHVKLVRDNQTFSKVTGKAGDSFAVSLFRIPSLWVGDYVRGINFTAENLANWNFRDPEKHAEMKRDKDAARLRFLFASAPLTITEPREYNFGLTVTPVKPLNTALLRQREKKDWQLYEPWYHFNYLNPERIRTEEPWGGMRFFNSQHKMFPVLFAYSAFNFAGPFAPEWTWYEEEWRQIKHGRTYGIWTGTKPYAYCEGCINGADYRNFRLNMLDRFLHWKDNPLLVPGTRNFYYDAPWEESCYNEKHGCKLWKDSTGQMRTHVLIDPFRDMALNIWRMTKRTAPEALITFHSEWQRMMPYQSLQDGMYGGEGMENEAAAKGSYYDIFTPAMFAATFSPYLWSAKMILIPQLQRGLQLNMPAKYRTYDLKNPVWRKAHLHYMGMAAVHDVDLSERNELSFLWWKAQDELGWNDKTVFFPYYADDPAIKVVSPVSDRIVASAYVNSGRLMLAVLNDTPKDEKITVRLDLNKLKVTAGLTGTDAFEPGLNWKLSPEWTDTIPARGFRLIVFK